MAGFILTVTARELVQIYFQEIFGFCPPILDIAISSGIRQEDTSYSEFAVRVGGVPYAFYIKEYATGLDRYIIGCYLFRSSLCTRLSVHLDQDGGYSAERI